MPSGHVLDNIDLQIKRLILYQHGNYLECFELPVKYTQCKESGHGK